MNNLLFEIAHIGTPPIKCQGIKTKLVPFLFSNIRWTAGNGRWIEPFLGSGVVAFNLAPERALLCDINPHIVRFYQAVQRGEINRETAREFLECEGKKLEAGGVDYYYEARTRFNAEASSFDFLFLNRCCFNGVMRFNRKGAFNVPFGHKPERFAKAHVTKIVNQIGWAAKQMQGRDWEFRVSDWNETLQSAKPEDFIYADPPYIGRHADYYGDWSEEQAQNLAVTMQEMPCGFALSMWLENRYRKNDHIAAHWSTMQMRTREHFYHVGSTESLRNAMQEALLIRPGLAVEALAPTIPIEPRITQMSLILEQSSAYKISA